MIYTQLRKNLVNKFFWCVIRYKFELILYFTVTPGRWNAVYSHNKSPNFTLEILPSVDDQLMIGRRVNGENKWFGMRVNNVLFNWIQMVLTSATPKMCSFKTKIVVGTEKMSKI